MTVLLDTHVWVWSLFQSAALHPVARAVLDAAHTVYVAPCSLNDITQKKSFRQMA